MKFLYIVLAHSFLGRTVSFSFRIETCKGGATLSGKRSPAPPHPSPLREKNVPSLISNWAQNTLLYRRLKWVSGVCKFDLLSHFFQWWEGKRPSEGPKTETSSKRVEKPTINAAQIHEAARFTSFKEILQMHDEDKFETILRNLPIQQTLRPRSH